MSTINITGENIKTFNFPGGECQVAILPSDRFDDGSKSDTKVITARITDSNGIIQLLLFTDALRREGYKKIGLILPYVPYARQDRVCNPGEAHSLKVFANLINSQNYEFVSVFDPHSDVTEAVLNNCLVENNHNFVRWALRSLGLNEGKNFNLVSPDAGAYKKIFYLGKFLANSKYSFDIVNCNKERDTKTGAINNFTVGATDLGGKPCVIVDDICDGGGTFLGLADALKVANAGPLYLVVSHGIFSQGFDKLLSKFEKIVFTNSFKDHAIPDELRNRLIVRPFI